MSEARRRRKKDIKEGRINQSRSMSLLENAEGSGRAATLQAAEFLKTYLEYHSYCDEDVSSVLSVSTTPTTKNSVMTRAMHEALARWQESIQCPLCWHPLCQPVSLPCAHTFCLDCIDAHVDRAWTCPSTYETAPSYCSTTSFLVFDAVFGILLLNTFSILFFVSPYWLPVVPNCNMPVTMKNPQGAKFRLLNPSTYGVSFG